MSRWSLSDDIRLSAQAHRALVNLDSEGNEGAKYARRIYLLHPLHRVHANTKMDVVFLHGLLGGIFVTWRQRDVNTFALGVVGLSIRHMAVYDRLRMMLLIIIFCLIIYLAGDNAQNQTTDYLSTMSDDDRPQEFFKDLARDLQLREWKKIGQDFEVILDDCPQNTNCRACGPYFCRG